jgi:hypothetical protein
MKYPVAALGMLLVGMNLLVFPEPSVGVLYKKSTITACAGELPKMAVIASVTSDFEVACISFSFGLGPPRTIERESAEN